MIEFYSSPYLAITNVLTLVLFSLFASILVIGGGWFLVNALRKRRDLETKGEMAILSYCLAALGAAFILMIVMATVSWAGIDDTHRHYSSEIEKTYGISLTNDQVRDLNLSGDKAVGERITDTPVFVATDENSISLMAVKVAGGFELYTYGAQGPLKELTPLAEASK